MNAAVHRFTTRAISGVFLADWQLGWPSHSVAGHFQVRRFCTEETPGIQCCEIVPLTGKI